MSMLKLYRCYLVALSKCKGRPFNLPKTIDSLLVRPEYKLFKQLNYLLEKEGITKQEDVSRFMRLSGEFINSDSYHVTQVISDFPEILKFVKSYKEPDEEELCRYIQRSFSFLYEYMLVNDVSDKQELCVGNPPLILKFWKNKKVHELVLVSMFRFSELRNKTWFNIYCNYFTKSKVAELRAKITKSKSVFLEIKNGMVKLDRSLVKV